MHMHAFQILVWDLKIVKSWFWENWLIYYLTKTHKIYMYGKSITFVPNKILKSVSKVN